MPTTFFVIATIVAAVILFLITAFTKEILVRKGIYEANKKPYEVLMITSIIVVIICIFLSAFSFYANSSNISALQTNSTIKAALDAVSTVWQDNRNKNDNPAEYKNLFSAIPKTNFLVQKPYVVFSNDGYRLSPSKKSQNYLIKYSGGFLLNDSAISNAKTIIYAQPSYAGSTMYDKVNKRGQKMGAVGVKTYGVDIYYYDAGSKKLVGYESLPAPKFPKKLYGKATSIKSSDKDILNAVQARIAK